MALGGALFHLVHVVAGFTNKSLRAHVAGLLGTDYRFAQMSYDHLRLLGPIKRLSGTNTYVPTPEGAWVAVFCTKMHHRLLGPLLEADRPQTLLELRRTLGTIDHIINDYVAGARLGTAA